MKRRQLLKYGTFAACGYGLAACQNSNRSNTGQTTDQSATPSRKITGKPDSFKTLEKTQLALGYAPTVSVLPWLVAIEEGFFDEFSLEVSLYKQPNMQEVEQGLLESRFDAAITPFSTPLIYQLKEPRINFQALMQLHRNGGVFTFKQNAWDADVRSGIDYTNFIEFSRIFRDYARSLPSLSFGVDNLYNVPAYLYRYWWAAMGFHPDLDMDLQEFAPSELFHKLRANTIYGYCSPEPWAQQAIEKRQGYIGCLASDVWRGHPGDVMTTDAGWVEENPNTAMALIAATLMGCEYCQDSSNARRVADIASEPLDTHSSNIETILNGQYFYGGEGDRPISRKDNPIWFDQGKRLIPPDSSNYCWQSHGIWLLTQMTRWRHFGLKSYPENAETLVSEAYPNKPYNDVAKALKLNFPEKTSQLEPTFIDQRNFTPDRPVHYINQFKLRT